VRAWELARRRLLVPVAIGWSFGVVTTIGMIVLLDRKSVV
jgi:hypothetical protein